jgi:hypothetical protein
VVTIGALLGMAAHLDGKGVTVLDMTGLAQKGGAVMSHVRLAERQEQLHSARIATGEARLLLGCDIVVAVSDDALSKTTAGSRRPSSTPGAASPANSCAIPIANSPSRRHGTGGGRCRRPRGDAPSSTPAQMATR